MIEQDIIKKLAIEHKVSLDGFLADSALPNWYEQLEAFAKSYHEAIERQRSNGEAVLFARKSDIDHILKLKGHSHHVVATQTHSGDGVYSVPLFTAPQQSPIRLVEALRDISNVALHHNLDENAPDKYKANNLLANNMQVIAKQALIDYELASAPIEANSEIKAYLVDGRIEQGLFFDKESATVMAEANCGIVVPLVAIEVQQSVTQALEANGQPYGIVDPDYARIYSKVRCVAWMYGYAVLMQGSFTRDLDLLIVPWTERVSTEPDHIIKMICDKCNLEENGHPPTIKPHGRIAYTLMFKEFGDPRFIDIGFMPALIPSTQAEVK